MHLPQTLPILASDQFVLFPKLPNSLRLFLNLSCPAVLIQSFTSSVSSLPTYSMVSFDATDIDYINVRIKDLYGKLGLELTCFGTKYGTRALALNIQVHDDLTSVGDTELSETAKIGLGVGIGVGVRTLLTAKPPRNRIRLSHWLNFSRVNHHWSNYCRLYEPTIEEASTKSSACSSSYFDV